MDRRVLTLNFKETLSALSDLMMPRVCLVCGRTLTLRERLLCLPCSLDLPLTRFENWEHNPMADKYNERIIKEEYEPYQRAAALLYYRHGSGYANIPQGLKYGRNFEAGRHFGAMLGRRMAASQLFADIDLVVPVPLHWTRRLRRGYNQAEIIAREIARELSVPLAPRLLRRVRRTRSQTRMSISEKSRNVSGAFTVRQSVLKQFPKDTPPTKLLQSGACVHTLHDSGGGMCKNDQKRTYPRSFSGGYARTVKHILLVDDVFTTGSTLTACHDALRKVFGPDVRISLATLSFAG